MHGTGTPRWTESRADAASCANRLDQHGHLWHPFRIRGIVDLAARAEATDRDRPRQGSRSLAQPHPPPSRACRQARSCAPRWTCLPRSAAARGDSSTPRRERSPQLLHASDRADALPPPEPQAPQSSSTAPSSSTAACGRRTGTTALSTARRSRGASTSTSSLLRSSSRRTRSTRRRRSR